MGSESESVRGSVGGKTFEEMAGETTNLISRLVELGRVQLLGFHQESSDTVQNCPVHLSLTIQTLTLWRWRERREYGGQELLSVGVIESGDGRSGPIGVAGFEVRLGRLEIGVGKSFELSDERRFPG